MKLKAGIDLTRDDANKLIHWIGNTPIQTISLMIEGVARKVSLKLEGENPTGSMKDRTGYALVQHLEHQGMLKEKMTIVESTSGNLGVALALLCRAKGYQFLAVIDPKTTRENIIKMESLGAQIEMVDHPDATGGYLLSRLERIQELCALSSTYAWVNQYASPANPHIHYTSTGPEIYHQMDGKVNAIFIPVSTGGTLAGISCFFHQVSPLTRIIGVDAYGSIVFGTPPAPRKLTGIGSSRPSHFINKELYDTYMLVKDEEAFAFCRVLDDMAGIKVGGSSGAVLAACARYLFENPDLSDVVCVCADSGENYTSSIFNDEWLQQQGLSLSRNYLCKIQEILSIHDSNENKACKSKDRAVE